MANRGAFDEIAAFYDDDMGLNAPPGDVEFYVSQAGRTGGPVLELGCGTGRIALPMVKAGYEVEGVDASLPMLDMLRAKAPVQLTGTQRQLLHLIHVDMRDCPAERKFPLILCPYSTFNYLLAESEQMMVLERVRTLLAQKGRFILDMFVPHYDLLLLPDAHVFHDYRRTRSDGSLLEREKTIRKDLTQQINVVTRSYRFLNADGSEIREFATEETIRYFFRSELRLLLERCGFRVEEEYGDFQGLPYRYEAQVMIFICSAR